MHLKASERCEERKASMLVRKRKGAKREKEIKKETGNSYANVCRCASVCVALREGG